MSSVPLPDFFQSVGYSGNNTLLDQLEDFELGGLEDDTLEAPLNGDMGEPFEDSAALNDDSSFNHFNSIADITKSPNSFLNNQQPNEIKGKFNALEMLKLEMGLNNVDINSNLLIDKSAKISSIINKTPYNVVMPNSVGINNEPQLNFLFPGNTHIPPQLPGMAPYQSTPLPSNISKSIQPPPPPPPGLPPVAMTAGPEGLVNQATGLTQSFGFPMPPVPVISTPAPAPKPFIIPRSQMMTMSDMRFVLTKIIQPLESPDPYADDFYYIQLNLKRNAVAHEKIRKGEINTPLPTFVAPLPTWKDTKYRIKNQILESQKNLEDRTREWEEKEKVLGHQVRSNIARPRELLSLSSLNDTTMTGNDVEGAGSADDFKTMFGTRLWTMRRAVQRGNEALHTVQELEHLLRTPLIWNNMEARREVLAEIDEAVELLSQAIGIRSMKSLHLIEEGYMGLGYAHGHVDSSAGKLCEVE